MLGAIYVYTTPDPVINIRAISTLIIGLLIVLYRYSDVFENLASNFLCFQITIQAIPLVIGSIAILVAILLVPDLGFVLYFFVKLSLIPIVGALAALVAYFIYCVCGMHRRNLV